MFFRRKTAKPARRPEFTVEKNPAQRFFDSPAAAALRPPFSTLIFRTQTGGSFIFTLSDIRAEFDRLDAFSGLYTKEIPIRISKRMSRSLGICRSRSTDGGATVEPVDVAFADYLCRFGTEEEFFNTIRHEYAHLYNIMHDGVRCGHDARWKQTALWLGASLERIARYEDLLRRAKAGGGLPKRKKAGKRRRQERGRK